MLVLPLVGLLAGCSNSELRLEPVEGQVTLNGQPVSQAGVVFSTTIGPLGTGVTDANGHFTISTANKPGALAGEHVVTIAKWTGSSAETNEQGTMGKLGSQQNAEAFPYKYASPDTTDLRAVVVAGEKNHFDFNLTK